MSTKRARRAPERPPADEVYVKPSPALPPGEYLPGIPATGAYVPARLAAEWIDAGVAVRATPPAAPAPEG